MEERVVMCEGAVEGDIIPPGPFFWKASPRYPIERER
jgi:hypothetical protein